jgi:hypothetical protein
LSILALSYKQARKLESNLIKIKPVSMLLFIWGVATGTAFLTTFSTVGYNAEEQFCVDVSKTKHNIFSVTVDVILLKKLNTWYTCTSKICGSGK